jgi:hypothetical protein
VRIEDSLETSASVWQCLELGGRGREHLVNQADTLRCARGLAGKATDGDRRAHGPAVRDLERHELPDAVNAEREAA